MVLKVHITDSATNITADVVKKEACKCKAVAVATVPFREFENETKFFFNDDYGVDMNIDAAPTGTPVEIHNGTDNVGTTTGTTSNKLVDTNNNFTDSIYIGMTVYNTTDATTAEITAIDSATVLSLDSDIMVSGETYVIGEYWTATNIVGGKMTDDSTDRPHIGDKSIKVDKPAVDNIWQLLNTVDTDMTLFQSITIWINVDKDWKLGDIVEIYGWDTTSGLIVGVAVDLKNYFAYTTYDVYQKIVIPLTDFGDLVESTTLDAFRVRQVAAEGKAPKYYLDDVALELKGVEMPTKYTVKADLGTWLYVDTFTISIASPTAIATAILADSTMPRLSYDDILGVDLNSGINYRRVADGETIFSVNIKTLMDFLQQPNTKIVSMGYDTVSTFVTVEVRNAEPLLLKPEDDDELSFTVNDDLSGLLHLRVSAGCRVEQRELGGK